MSFNHELLFLLLSAKRNLFSTLWHFACEFYVLLFPCCFHLCGRLNQHTTTNFHVAFALFQLTLSALDHVYSTQCAINICIPKNFHTHNALSIYTLIKKKISMSYTLQMTVERDCSRKFASFNVK